jgi:hypothetical protein
MKILLILQSNNGQPHFEVGRRHQATSDYIRHQGTSIKDDGSYPECPEDLLGQGLQGKVVMSSGSFSESLPKE